MNVGAPMSEAISAVPYATSVKVGLQFKRRFWEQDEQIYGGVTYTDLPIARSVTRAAASSATARACCWAPIFGTARFYGVHVDAAGRARAKAVEYGSQIHPQYTPGIRQRRGGRLASRAVRAGLLRPLDRMQPAREHYDNLCEFDGRIVLAGEHASYLPAWQEGAVTSALDAIDRLHRRALAAAPATGPRGAT